MIPRKMTIVLMLLATASAGAQPDTPAHDGAGVTVGTVTGQDVYIRSDHTVNAYPCAKISAPDTVDIIGQDGDWLQILPPPGLVFSVISKDYVDLPPGERIGTVTGDVVRVYAGSDEWDLAGLAGHYVIQGHLNTGDTVVVIGEGVDYYEIAPPGGAFVWISSQFVRIGDAPADETATDTDDAEQEDAQGPAALTEAGRQFQLVGQSLLQELRKPRSQQDLRGLLAEYQAIDVPAGSVLSIAIDRRVAYLQDLIELQDEAAEVERMAALSRARRTDFQRRAHDADGQQPVAPQPLGSEFTAWGVLSPSGVYSGGPAPRRYLLRNPDTRRITAYARSVDGEVDLSDYEGRLIGVFGRATYEADTGLNVVDVVRVEFLTPVEAPVEPVMPSLVPPADDAAVPDQPVPPVPAGPDQGPVGPPPPIPPEPILVEPDRPVTDDSPPELAPQPDDETPSTTPDQTAPPPDAEEPQPDVPDQPERPSVLIHPPEDEGPSTAPARPVRPSRSTIRPQPIPADDESEPPSTPSAPPAEDTAPQGPPRPDSDVAPPPAQTPQEPVEDEEQPQTPPRPIVDMHQPLPPEGLPSDEEPPADTPSINPDEYD